jgi:hypothetical protein
MHLPEALRSFKGPRRKYFSNDFEYETRGDFAY